MAFLASKACTKWHAVSEWCSVCLHMLFCVPFVHKQQHFLLLHDLSQQTLPSPKNAGGFAERVAGGEAAARRCPKQCPNQTGLKQCFLTSAHQLQMFQAQGQLGCFCLTEKLAGALDSQGITQESNRHGCGLNKTGLVALSNFALRCEQWAGSEHHVHMG